MPPRTGSSRRTPQSNSTSNIDFKTLKLLYRQQLPTLRELFPGWNQEDLLAAMHEANGDLELTIGRIMEGHANQWDQVKTKKSKPQQKQANAGGADSSSEKRIDGPNGTRGVSRGSRSRNGKSRGKYNDKSLGNKKGTEKSSTSADEKKPSWASILKGPPVLSTVQPEITTSNDADIDNGKTIEPDNLKKDSVDGDGYEDNQFIITEEIQDPFINSVEPMAHESDLTADILTQIGDNTFETVEEQQKGTDDKDEEKENDERLTSTQLVSIPESPITTQESQRNMSFRKVPVRRLKQDEPVVLPPGGSALENVNMQFGSLNLTNGEEQPIPKVQHVEEVDQNDQQQHQYEQNEKQTLTATTTPVPAPSTALSTNTPTQVETLSSTAVTVNPKVPSDITHRADTNVYNSQPQFPTYQQYQSHQQPLSFHHQEHHSTDPQINSYASYPPKPIPGNGQLHHFVNPAMTTMPDYHNSDSHRSSSYYDPNIYNRSPSVDNAHLNSRGKFSNGQEGLAPLSNSIGMMGKNAPTTIIQQQPLTNVYDGNVGGYYPYYYMPNQYQNYPQNGYQRQHTSQPLQQTHQAPQSSYIASGSYPVYEKQNSSAYHHYSNQQEYDESGMLHTNESQGFMYDKSYPSAPQMQNYLNINSHPQPKELMMNGLDKHGSEQQYQVPVHGDYHLQYQDHQQQQPFLYQQHPYIPTVPNNAYRQNQPQQNQYWHQV